MSESQVNHFAAGPSPSPQPQSPNPTPPAQNTTAVPKPNIQPTASNSPMPATSTPTTSPTPASTPTPTSTPTPMPAATHPQYDSAGIGTKTAQRQDPFAEQNQRRAEKEAKAIKKRKQILWITIPTILVVLILTVIGIVYFATRVKDTFDDTIDFDNDTITKDMSDLQDLAQDAFKNEVTQDESGITISGDTEAAEKIFEDTLANPANKEYANQINLSRMLFYIDNGKYESVIETSSGINPDELDGDQKVLYYNALNLAYAGLGDTEKSYEYIRLQGEAILQNGGGGQG